MTPWTKRALERALLAGVVLVATPLNLMQVNLHGQAAAQGAGKGIQANLDHPVLPIGSPLPDFTLPGVDGKTHKASEYGGTKLLALVFESNHCPVSQLYEGRIDDNQREDLVKTHDARNAIDALLADKPVPVAETTAFGCTTKWLSKASGVEQEWARIQKEPVTVDPVGAEDLKKLRTNPTDKVMLVHFWATECAACTSEFLDLETTYRMYRKRAFDLITVSTNGPSESAAVLDFLKKEYASSPNKQFATADRAALQAAWGVKWNPAAPLTMVIAPGGKVLYQKEGKFDILEVRRVVLANMPDTSGYIGSKAYWMSAVEEMARKK